MAEKVEYIISLRDLFTPKLKDASNAADKLDEKVDGLSSSVGSLGSVIAALGLGALAYNTVGVAAKFQSLSNAINFASGTAEEGEKNITFLRETSERLGLDVMASAEGFKTLSGAMMGSKLQGDTTRDIFESVAIGASAMGLTAEQSEGAFLALGQMMGKGKVQAEELRGQLGERIPGAFQIAARSMNMTTAQLDKFMSDGKLTAEEFLPKFAQEMRKTFTGALGESSQSIQSNINRLGNFKDKIQIELIPVISSLLEKLVSLTTWFTNNTSIVYGFVSVLGVIGLAWLSYVGYLKLVALWQGIVAATNPVTLIIMGIAALVGVVVWAWNEFEGFRQVFWGLWEAAKQVFTNIGTFFKVTFNPIFEAIKAIKEGRWLDAGKAVAQLAYNLSPVGLAVNFGKNITTGVGDAFNKGAEEGKDKKATGISGLTTSSGGGLSPGPLDPKKENKGLGTSISDVKGTRPTNVTVNINKLVETLSITTNNISDFRGRLEEEVKKVLLTAVNDVNIIQQ